MLEIFISKVSDDLLNLRGAINNKEIKTIKRISHDLKNSMPFAGLLHLNPILTEIENDAMKNSISKSTSDKFTRINEEVKKYIPGIQKILSTNYN